VLAGPLRGTGGVLGAEADLDEATPAKSDPDTVGHYTRPDVFAPTVDGTPELPSGPAAPHRGGRAGARPAFPEAPPPPRSGAASEPSLRALTPRTP
jgi:hypothetical protein